MPIDRDELSTLEARQVAFFQKRITSDQARDEWCAKIAAVYSDLLAAPLGSLVDPALLLDAVDAALADDALERAARPISRAIAVGVVKALREDQTRVGDYVTPKVRAKISAVLERPNLVDDRFIRAVIEQDAVEEMMRDVLYDTIREFNDKANPIFAEWGLVSMLKRFFPIGFGTVARSIEGVRGEFDRRLEPEIRRFLQGFSRQALRKMADFAIAKKDEPKFIALRKNIAAFVYEERLSEVTASAEDELTRMIHEVVLDIVAHASQMPNVREQRHAVVRAFVAQHEQDSVADVLVHYGASHPPDVTVFARAAWPLVRAALQSEPVRRYIADLVAESYE